MEREFQVCPSWRLEMRESELTIIGGSDAIFSITVGDESCFLAEVGSKKFTREDVPMSNLPAFEQLLSAGVIIPLIRKETAGRKRKIYLRSSSLPTLAATSEYEPVDSAEKADFIILHRSAGSLDDFIKAVDYGNISKAHLFLDSAYRHVVSLGPLVFPGDTACLNCLTGRLAYRWEDIQPPDEPRADTDLADVLHSFLICELRKILVEDNCFLANRTLVFDSQARKMKSNKLLRVPDCPYCALHCQADPQVVDHNKLFVP